MKEGNKARIRKLIVLIILGIIGINIPLISAYIILVKYGTFTIYPGENYIINIPFISESKLTSICGTAKESDGTLLSGITVVLKYYNNNTDFMTNTTGKDGKFCFKLNNINSNKKFDVYVNYDNSTLTLGSNDYTLNFDNNKVYSKNTDKCAILTGDITNEDAQIDNGRFEIRMANRINGSWEYNFGDYQKYYLNIDSNEVYEIPNNELNFSKSISELSPGEYKFYAKTSFNGKERTKDVLFNITA